MTGLSHTTVAAFVDELVRAGVHHFAACPGSRSTPLVLAIAAHRSARLWMHLDERSAGFFGLGLAKATQSPVALLCSSGTAAANFLPAVVEAFLSRVPLVVLTADRPADLHDSGALQTIDQQRIYGSHVKWFTNLPEPDDSQEVVRFTRAVAGRAVGLSLERPRGPVHLNYPFSEPLVATFPGPPPPASRELGPYVALSTGERLLDGGQIGGLADSLGGRRGVIVCGPQDDAGLAAPLVGLAAALGFPLLADPLSQVRCGPHYSARVIDAYDTFLRDDSVAAQLEPETVLRFGAFPTSKPLQSYLERWPQVQHIVVDGGDGWLDPTHGHARFVHVGERHLSHALTSFISQRDGLSSDGDWLERWQRLNRLSREALAAHLSVQAELSEGKTFAELANLLPDGSTLYVGNSMPLRDVDTFFPASDRRIRIFGNRGASGIDGVVSSALGVAAAGEGPTVLVIGDISLYHDSNGLLAAGRHGLDLTIVLLNNDGGGIFSFLAQATHVERETFELLFGTPHGLDFRPIVEAHGGCFVRAESWDDFRDFFSDRSARGLRVIEVPTERQRNVEVHVAAWRAVLDQLRAAAATVGADPKWVS